MATEKQIQYLETLIANAQAALAYDYPGMSFFDYLSAKYPNITREEKRALDKKAEKAAFVQGLNDYLDSLKPTEMDKAQASQHIDALKGGWVSRAIDWMLS